MSDQPPFTAIITGAGRGIGAACAATFTGAGWNVVLVDRDAGELRAAAEACGGRHHRRGHRPARRCQPPGRDLPRASCAWRARADIREPHRDGVEDRSGRTTRLAAVLRDEGRGGSARPSAGARLAPEGIRVNAVCPGIVDTPMLDRFLDELPDPERAHREFATAQPLGRLARLEECATAARFLASTGASFITGVALPVDGGFTAQ